MARTTVNIDDPVLLDLKRLQKKEGKSLGRLVTELLVKALSLEKATGHKAPAFKWISRNMGVPLVELNDKEALHAVLDRDALEKLRR